MSYPCASEYRPSMSCWQVRDMYDRATRTLASNLAIAAVLCAAHYVGFVQGFYFDSGDERWRPGCGRPVRQ